MQNSQTANPQLFASMLQQQGYSPAANLVNTTGAMGASQPQLQPPVPAPASAQQMQNKPPMMQQSPLQQPGMATNRAPVTTTQNSDQQQRAAVLLRQLHSLEAQHGSPKPGSAQAAQLNQLKNILLDSLAGGQSQKPQFNSQEAAALGRMGDTTVVHMTPGEITVPKELQTPEMLATMQQEYGKMGLSPQQFTVGSSAASINPQTGMQEFSFWSSFLPIVGGVVGGIFGGPLGAGAGSALGSLASGKKWDEALLSGAMSGIGSWGAGQLFGDALGSATDILGTAGEKTAEETAKTAASTAADAASTLPTDALQGLASEPNYMTQLATAAAKDIAPQKVAENAGLFSRMITPSSNISNMLGAGAGSMLGGAMFAPTSSGKYAEPSYPSGFKTPLDAVGSLGSAQQQLGQSNNTSYQPATFQGYNPNTNYTSAYNFFPQTGQTNNVPAYNNY